MSESTTSTPDTVPSAPEQLTPAQVWQAMRQGNNRFVSGAPQHPRQDVERREELLTYGQNPRAALFGCSDSRLAAEIIFDMGLGDLFVVRNAGQVVSNSALGSLEYAVSVVHVPLIVVLGHDRCGAVEAAIASLAPDAEPLPPHINELVEKIHPAVRRVSGIAAPHPIDPEKVDAAFAGREHLRATVANLLESSEVLSAAVANGTLAIVGANYRLLEGRADVDIVVGSV